MNMQLLKEEYQWVGYIILLVSVWAFLPLKKIFNKSQRLSMWDILTIAGFFYPVTKIAQIFQIGPSWFRGYFSDIGFVPFFALFLLGTFPKPKLLEGQDPWIALLVRVKLVKRLTWYSAFIAMSWELLNIYVQDHGLVPRKAWVSTGDYADLWIFFVTLVLQLLFLSRQEQNVRDVIQANEPAPVVSRSKKEKMRRKKVKVG